MRHHLKRLINVWSGSVEIKRWTTDPEVRGSIPDLTRTFLKHCVFPNQLEMN